MAARFLGVCCSHAQAVTLIVSLFVGLGFGLGAGDNPANGPEHVWIIATPAKVFLETSQDLLVGSLRLLVEEPHDTKNHSWGAVSTLESTFCQKGFLDWMQVVVLGQTLDRKNG